MIFHWLVEHIPIYLVFLRFSLLIFCVKHIIYIIVHSWILRVLDTPFRICTRVDPMCVYCNVQCVWVSDGYVRILVYKQIPIKILAFYLYSKTSSPDHLVPSIHVNPETYHIICNLVQNLLCLTSCCIFIIYVYHCAMIKNKIYLR